MTKLIQALKLVLGDRNIYQVTVFENPKFRYKVSRKKYKRIKRPSKLQEDLVVTIGRPNYNERAYVKKMKGHALDPMIKYFKK